MTRLAWTVLLFASISLAADQGQWQGTWVATAGGGIALAGTWNAVPGEAPDTIAGSWSLRDQNGSELATGTWAAGKEGKVWKGTWQARRASSQVYDGSWRAPSELPATARLPGLLEAAISNAISGSWRMGSYAGAWTIRAYAPR
jgi:hypothetical protein